MFSVFPRLASKWVEVVICFRNNKWLLILESPALEIRKEKKNDFKSWRELEVFFHSYNRWCRIDLVSKNIFIKHIVYDAHGLDISGGEKMTWHITQTWRHTDKMLRFKAIHCKFWMIWEMFTFYRDYKKRDIL